MGPGKADLVFLSLADACIPVRFRLGSSTLRRDEVSKKKKPVMDDRLTFIRHEFHNEVRDYQMEMSRAVVVSIAILKGEPLFRGIGLSCCSIFDRFDRVRAVTISDGRAYKNALKGLEETLEDPPVYSSAEYFEMAKKLAEEKVRAVDKRYRRKAYRFKEKLLDTVCDTSSVWLTAFSNRISLKSKRIVELEKNWFELTIEDGLKAKRIVLLEKERDGRNAIIQARANGYLD